LACYNIPGLARGLFNPFFYAAELILAACFLVSVTLLVIDLRGVYGKTSKSIES
jgi:hypothetical protein